MTRKLGLAATVGALAVALILVLAACGSSSDSEGVASLTDTTGQTTTGGAQGSGDSGASKLDPQEAGLAYAKCMREHGIDMADPVNGRIELNIEPGTPEEKVEEAQEACGDILQNVAPGPGAEERQAELQDAALAFAKCMREHGIDMPDPQFDENGGVRQQAPEGGADDPKFQDAEKACRASLDDGPVENGGGGS